MASYNVVFAIDVDYRSEERNVSTDECHDYVKRWVLRVLLSLGSKYGFEKVRWGYRFFHSRTVKGAGLITRGTDFRELQEKAFGEFEEELVKYGAIHRTSDGQRRLQPSPANCMQNALKEILLDFQWDRPDITSPTKLTLRPRRSCRSSKNISLADDELSCLGKNVLFVVSTCPHSRSELEEFLCSSDSGSHRDLHEFVLAKRIIDLLIQRKVVLHWADCSFYKGGSEFDDHIGLNTVMEVLEQVAGKVIPVLTPCLALKHEHPDLGFVDDEGKHALPTSSSTDYILCSEKTYQQAFPAVVGTLCWGADEDKQTCSVSFESVSCRQRPLCAPIEVTLTTVLQGLDTSSLRQSASECWVLLCPDKPEQGRLCFQGLLKELSLRASHMLAEVSEGSLVRSAVLSVLSPYIALLTVLQPLATHCEEVLDKSLISSETAENSADLPDVVHSVLNVMYDIMKDEDRTEEMSHPQIPDWANQELQQWTNLAADVTEGWFCLSDQSGISSHLMESMRLLHAAPDEEEQREEDTQLELTHTLAELYQSGRTGTNTGPNGKKKGAQRTPVRQKMKTMSRSLQMLNVARFNIKEQKSQAEVDLSSTAKGTEKQNRRCSGERTKSGPMYFKNEEELLSHLKLGYQQAVEDRSLSLFGQVQNLLSVVKTFLKSNTHTEVSFFDLIKKNLLKSPQCIRQLHGSTSDTESKIRDCQLQVVLRLEVCRQPSSDQDPDYVEQMVEEVAGMLQIISRTNDPVYLSKFMQEELLKLYLKDIPKVLADIYHSLGIQLPEALVAVLPSDFFSDDSMAKESVSVSPSPLSGTQSMVSSVGNRLEELRNRSAKKRRTSMLSRHKSMTEVSQALRQIEMPRKSTRQTKPKMCASSEKRSVGSLPPQKQAVQEVTKVRRNLFNQETVSPSKKVKMPRSQSVSALEGMKKRKRSQMDEDRNTLLTKKVSETPLHKQVSNRLLQRQKSGRRSGETDMFIIEESPVKPATDLRRSPRIKNLARRHSSVFYSSSQPRSRNLDRALSTSQVLISESKGGINVDGVKSPMRLLFGAAQSPVRPSTSSWGTRHSGKVRLESTDSVFENCNKTPRKSPYKSPYKSAYAVGSRTPRTPSSSSKAQGSPYSKSPGHIVGENGMILRGSPFRSPAAKSLLMETPKKSPLKGILRTPVKSFMEYGTLSGSCPRSPSMKTPKKSVTWSPSPRKCPSEKTFKVPESPQSSKRYSPKLITPSKFCRFQGDVFKTPDKLPQRKCKTSPETQTVSEITGNIGLKEPTLGQRSQNTRRTLSLPEKVDPQSLDILSIDHSSPPTPEMTTPKKSPEPEHRMCTRSGRTPLKSISTVPYHKAKSPLGSSPSSSKGVFLPMKEKPLKPFLRSHSTGNTSASTSHPKSSTDHTGDKQTLDREPWTTKAVAGHNESTKVMMEEESSSDSQQIDSSQCSATTTEESIDIAEASVVRTELTGGIKMNISFSRKSSKSSGVFEFTGTPSLPAEGCSYGFRQTPDRQQRKAAARLGYSPGLLRFSTPRASGTPGQGKKPAEPNPLTYQVELEMQASGLPKLKFKRTDSFSSGEAADYAAKGLAPHIMTAKAPKVDSPLAHCSKHREHGCISPPLCTHDTPGKGGVQTYICQSITPTRLSNNSPSPLGAGENMPWTPSPQSRGWSTPENLNSWPRIKRARTDMLGTKENVFKSEVEVLEDPELDGVFRLQGAEDLKESRTPASKYKLVATPPSSKVKKPVSVSGIIALTQSPLLYKGAKATVTKETTQSDASNGNSEQYGSKGILSLEVSPFSQPRKRQGCGRTYSRKRLLES
ncbi:LOW QUALITY PROTEIN: treslin [Colossoma macropomum]|uniref:LOW QUALITY PROTEIN: treslin n=1 Tax=Colossoma macropomum TaxID=42526 RepID=UPI001864E224|nr:LOW QUALITY PROTEIN: treslin [Colossoma macropomum]